MVVGSGLRYEANAQNPTRARTESGREVLLYPDGTWKYAEVATREPTRPGAFNRPATADKAVTSQKVAFKIWIDQSKWKESRKASEAVEFQFAYVTGDAYAMAITERLSIPLSSLKEIAVTNAKGVAPDIRVVLEEERTVNGLKVMCLVMEGTVKGIGFTYYGYYYSDKTGTIQLVTYTGQTLFQEFKPELTKFLNGLEAYER